MNTSKQRTISLLSVKAMTIMAMLGAISVVLMQFGIPLWFTPFFYELEFSEVPALIGAFALGPMAGVIIQMIKILLDFAISSTKTAGVGEIANFIIGCSFVVPAAIIYHKKKTLKSAIQGLIVGTLIMVILGGVLNAFVLLPAYVYFTSSFESVADIIAIGTKENSAINNMSTFIFYAVVPFNLIKGVLDALITILIYKKISGIIKSYAQM
ncbi:MAG: ECF transporter S component [Bacillota bacterium]|nr:ECF transporter S component [Bacillota bacterium]